MVDGKLFQTDYDRASCKIGIVHLGFGAFHRAHQAVYIDDYMQQTGDLRWGIAAVKRMQLVFIRPLRPKMAMF